VDDKAGIFFVDNQEIFRVAIRWAGYAAFFSDCFTCFGHCTSRGNQLLAENIAESIIREFYPSSTNIKRVDE